MHEIQGTRPSVLLRDLALFYIKLALDGMKDVALVWLAGFAVLADLAVGGPKRGQYFYAVMRLGERVDLWLNVYAPANRAALNPEGLFGESRSGEDSYMGKMEEMLGGDRPPRPVRQPR
jgi:hypothetical protein